MTETATAPAAPRAPQAVLTPERERLVIALLALAAFVLAINASVMGPLFPFLGELALTKEQKGTLLGAPNLACALAALLLGPLVDRVGRRPPLLVGLLAFAVLSLLHLLARDYAQLLALRIATGLALGLAYTSASAAVGDLVPYFRLGKAMGVFSSGLFFATAVGIPLAVLCADRGSWRTVFALQAVLALAACSGAFLLPKQLGRGTTRVSVLVVLRQRAVVPTLVAILVSVGAFAASVQLAGDWLDHAEILPKRDHPWLWAGLGLCSALGSVFLTPLADRLGKRNFALVSAVLLFGLLAMLAQARTFSAVAALGIPLAVVGGARTGAAQALVSELVPMNMRGTLMGLRSAAVTGGIGLCCFAGEALFGPDGYPSFLRVSGAMMIVSYLLVRFFVPREL